jgi:Flp pilus assembly protein TadB
MAFASLRRFVHVRGFHAGRRLEVALAALDFVVQTQRQAQRGLDFRAPWLSLLAAAAALVALGVVWLSVRAQHHTRVRPPWDCSGYTRSC